MNLTNGATFPTSLFKRARSRINQKIKSPRDTNPRNPAWDKGPISYFNIHSLIDPPFQICAFVCLRKLQNGVYPNVRPTCLVGKIQD